MRARAKFYVVWKGRKAGVFSSWEECAVQVQGFPDAQYKAFASRAAAEQAFSEKYAAHVGKLASGKDWLFAPTPPLQGSWCVDASCSGSPGRLEYRGVELQTGREIFRKGPYEHGTNNIGEFLAIVHALTILEKRRTDLPIYSDSRIAIDWVQKKRCNTELAAVDKNRMLFALIHSAEEWLTRNTYANPVLKWDTEAWGEIPADFNRK